MTYSSKFTTGGRVLWYILLWAMIFLPENPTFAITISHNHPSVVYIGRHQRSEDSVRFDWSQVKIEAHFRGTGNISVRMNGRGSLFKIRINNRPQTLLAGFEEQTYVLAENLSDTDHKVTIEKMTEASYFFSSVFMKQGVTEFKGFEVSDGMKIQGIKRVSRRLEFFGDSSLTGFGLRGNSDLSTWNCLYNMVNYEDATGTYAAKLGDLFNAEIQIVAWSGKGVVKNAASFSSSPIDVMPAHWPQALGGDRGVPWSFRDWVPNLVVVHLGANDYASWPYPDELSFLTAYQKMLLRIRQSYRDPELPIIGLCGGGSTPNESYCPKVKAALGELNGASEGFFFIEIPSDLFDDRDNGCLSHRTESGHEKIAQFLQPKIGEILQW